MTRCPECGSENLDGAAECLYCGSRLSAGDAGSASSSRPLKGPRTPSPIPMILLIYAVFFVAAAGTLAYSVVCVVSLVVAAGWGLRMVWLAAKRDVPIGALPRLARYVTLATMGLALVAVAVAALVTALSLRTAFVAPLPSWRTTRLIEPFGILALGLAGLTLAGLLLGSVRPTPLRGAAAFLLAGASWVGVMVTWGYPVAMRHALASRKLTCLTNVKSLSMAVTMYLAENDNVLPVAHNWCEALTPYSDIDNPLRCPEAPALDCAFAYNARLAGVTEDALADPSRAIAIFESDRGWNAAGGPELLAREPRHLGGDNLGFVDGHATWMVRPRIDPMDRAAGYRRAYPDEYGVQWGP